MSVKFWLEKLILFLLISAVFGASLSLAQGQPFIVPPPTGTPLVSGTPFQSVNQACDKYGTCNVAVGGGASGLGMSIIPVSNSAGLNGPLTSNNGYFNVGTDTIEALSTTTVLVLTAHVARVGDLIIPTAGTAGNVDVAIPVCSVATNSVTLCYPLPATPSTDAITIRRPNPLYTPKEDSASVSGETGLPLLGVNNRSFASFNTTQLDYTPFGVNDYGTLRTDINVTSMTGTELAQSIAKQETVSTAANGDGGVSVLTKAQSALSVDIANGLYGTLKIDLAGRLITAPAPAAERWQSCSASNTGTSDTAIKALVASNKICATSLSCFNTAAVASSIVFKSAATQIYVGGIGNSTLNGVAYWEHTLGVPICTVAGEAFNFAMGTNSTATTCCGAGFITVE